MAQGEEPRIGLSPRQQGEESYFKAAVEVGAHGEESGNKEAVSAVKYAVGRSRCRKEEESNLEEADTSAEWAWSGAVVRE